MLEKDEFGYTLMNEKNLKIICERDGLYSFPELNEKLYCHYKGFFVFVLWLELCEIIKIIYDRIW